MRPAPALAALLLAAPAAAQHYVAPTDRTVFSSTQESNGEPAAHTISVENHSTVPVTVFGYRLTQCENVRQQCYPRSVRIRIPAGRRETIARVEPAMADRTFSYAFGFSWHADSSSLAALGALASGGVGTAREQLAATQRADSLDRATPGPHAHELTRDDYTALAGRAIVLRAAPDSLLLTPGERASVDRIRLLLVDSAGGAVLGRTRWLRYQTPNAPGLRFEPPDRMVASAPARVLLRFALAEEAQAVLGREVPEIEVPVRVAYPADPHAPTFAGTVTDADHHAPLACAEVALEDSAENVVARGRTTAAGAFRLATPHAGTYRVRVETMGWAPAYGPSEPAAAGATVQHEYPVRFTEQMLAGRAWAPPGELLHAYPASVSTAPTGARGAASTPVVQGVTVGGSESAPVLGIVGRVPAGSAWAQFVVDSAGHVDLRSLLLPAEAAPAQAAALRAMLPRVRFSPARADGRATCEMLRMQVTFVPR